MREAVTRLVAHDARDDDLILGFDVKGDLKVGYWF